MKQLVFDILPPPVPTLQNFVVGPNAELAATLQALLGGASTERFLYIWGGAGCGKSHLLRGFATAAAAHHLRAGVAPADELLDVDSVAQLDVLLVDDVLKLSELGQNALFNIFNRIRDGSGILLVSGPYAPTHLKLRPDLASRLAQSLIFQVKCLSDEDKARALMSHAQDRGFTLPRDVVTFLLTKWKRDLPALLSALDALDRYTLEVKRPVTVPLLREVLALLPKD